MGCDQGVGESVPYCKPKCKMFRLVSETFVGRVKAKCMRCRLEHDFFFTIEDGKIVIKIDQGEEKTTSTKSS
jgi:hypothetical protein